MGIRRTKIEELLGEVYQTCGQHGYPVLKNNGEMPLNLMPFSKVFNVRDELLKVTHVHFFEHDYIFERVWNQPKRYLKKLKEARGVIGVDFSCFFDAPRVVNIWNVFRNRMMDLLMQKNGIKVIPAIVWGGPDTFDFCFDGVPEGSIVAVSSHGCLRNGEELFIQGFEAMIKKLAPSAVVFYGPVPEELKTKYSDKICDYTVKYCVEEWKKKKLSRAEPEK